MPNLVANDKTQLDKTPLDIYYETLEKLNFDTSNQVPHTLENILIMQLYIGFLPFLRLFPDQFFCPRPEDLFTFYTRDQIHSLLNMCLDVFEEEFKDYNVAWNKNSETAADIMSGVASLGRAQFDSMILQDYGVEESEMKGGGNKEDDPIYMILKSQLVPDSSQSGGMPVEDSQAPPPPPAQSQAPPAPPAQSQVPPPPASLTPAAASLSTQSTEITTLSKEQLTQILSTFIAAGQGSIDPITKTALEEIIKIENQPFISGQDKEEAKRIILRKATAHTQQKLILTIQKMQTESVALIKLTTEENLIFEAISTLNIGTSIQQLLANLEKEENKQKIKKLLRDKLKLWLNTIKGSKEDIIEIQGEDGKTQNIKMGDLFHEIKRRDIRTNLGKDVPVVGGEFLNMVVNRVYFYTFLGVFNADEDGKFMLGAKEPFSEVPVVNQLGNLGPLRFVKKVTGVPAFNLGACLASGYFAAKEFQKFTEAIPAPKVDSKPLWKGRLRCLDGVELLVDENNLWIPKERANGAAALPVLNLLQEGLLRKNKGLAGFAVEDAVQGMFGGGSPAKIVKLVEAGDDNLDERFALQQRNMKKVIPEARKKLECANFDPKFKAIEVAKANLAKAGEGPGKQAAAAALVAAEAALAALPDINNEIGNAKQMCPMLEKGNKLFVENDANVGLAHEIDWAQVKEDAIIEIGLLANQMEKATKGRIGFVHEGFQFVPIDYGTHDPKKYACYLEDGIIKCRAKPIITVDRGWATGLFPREVNCGFGGALFAIGAGGLAGSVAAGSVLGASKLRPLPGDAFIATIAGVSVGVYTAYGFYTVDQCMPYLSESLVHYSTMAGTGLKIAGLSAASIFFLMQLSSRVSHIHSELKVQSQLNEIKSRRENIVFEEMYLEFFERVREEIKKTIDPNESVAFINHILPIIKTNVGDARKILLESFQKYNLAHNKWMLDNQKWLAEHSIQKTELTLQQQVNAAEKPAQAPPGTLFNPNKEPVLADFVDKSIIETIINEVSVKLFDNMHKEFLANIDLDKIKADIETTKQDHEKALKLVIANLEKATEFNRASYNSQKENLEKLIAEEQKRVSALAETNATQAYLTRSIFEKLSSDPEMINGVKDLWRTILTGKQEELKMKGEVKKNPIFGEGVNLLKSAVELNPAGKIKLPSAAGLAASTMSSKATINADGAASTFAHEAGAPEKFVRFGTNAAAASASAAPPPQAPVAQAQAQAPPPQVSRSRVQKPTAQPSAPPPQASAPAQEESSKAGNAVGNKEDAPPAGGRRYVKYTRKNKSKN